MENFEVELPDGTIIEGPTKEAALIAARKRLGISSGQRGSAPTQEEKKSSVPFNAASPIPTKEDLLRVGKNVGIGAAGLMGGEVLAPLLAPMLSSAPGLSGVTSEMLSGPLSSISMATLEKLLQGNFNPTDIGVSALGNEAVNLGMSKAVQVPGAIKRGIQEFRQPGSLVDKTLAKLGAPFSAYTGSRTAKLIEDTFAPIKKEQSFAASQEAAKKLINQGLSRIALNPVTLDDYMFLAGNARTSEVSNYYRSAAASTAKGELVKGIAQSNNGGPINMNDSIIKAKAILDDVGSDPKLQAVANNFLSKTQAVFDKAGNLITHTPLNFENAWQLQKDIGNFTARSFDSGEVNFNKTQLYKLYNSIGDDISNSVPKWQNNGQQAVQLWNDSKAIVKERQKAFFPETGISVGKTILPENENVAKDWNNIINDNHTLSKVIVNPKMPEATKAGVPVLNPRKELASYKLADLWKNSLSSDGTTFNTEQFLKQFNDPKFAQSESTSLPASRDLLYSKGTQEDIRRFVTALGKIQPGQSANYLKWKLGAGGAFTLGSGIASYMTTGSLPTSALVGGGVAGIGIGANTLAKIMLNKNYARVLVAMTEGSPLGMPEKAVARIFGNALKGEIVNVIYKDGNQVEGTVNSDGAVGISIK